MKANFKKIISGFLFSGELKKTFVLNESVPCNLVLGVKGDAQPGSPAAPVTSNPLKTKPSTHGQSPSVR